MEFIPIRKLRLEPKRIWHDLKKSGEMVVTSNGKPVAILSEVKEENLEETLADLRRIRAQRAVSKLRRYARSQGLRDDAKMIEQEVRAVRKNLSA